jgi:hypothetical protein
MGQATPLFNNWLFGELGELLAGRVDMDAYARGLSRCENYLALPQGAMAFRPGTYYLNASKTAGVRIRLKAYERGSLQNYVLELGNLYARIYTAHARIENPPGTPVEIVTPWPTAVLGELKFAQDDDLLYVFHPSYATQVIQRTTDDFTWTIGAALGAPFNSSGNYPSCGAFWQGRLVVAATVNEPQMVWGSYVGNYNTWQTWLMELGQAAAPADFAAGATLTGGTSGATSLVVTKITALLYVVKTLSGNYRYGETITDGTNTAPAVAGYPNVTPATGPSDPWSFRIASEKAQTIRWLVAGSDLLVGASGGEFIFTGGDGAFYAENFQIKQQGSQGSANLQAQPFGSRCLFVPKLGSQLRELYFTYERNGYVAPDLTALAPHIVACGVSEMAAQNVPSPILWVLRTDGALLAFGYDPSVSMAGWTRAVTEKLVESVAVISGTTEDELWVSFVLGTARQICYMKARNWGADQRDVFFVDAGLTVDYGTAKTISGATKADPVVITASSHGFANDQHVWIEGMEGMTELNGKIYTVKGASTHTFQLYNEEGSDGIDATFFNLKVASAPSPADFAPGATLTGALSGCTCQVFQKISSTEYLCRLRSTSFTDGENISDGTNTATGAAGYPIVTDLYGTWTAGGTAQRFEESVSGFSHLNGEEVDVVCDGANHPRRTVSGGVISLQVWANRIHAGLPYTGIMRLMRQNAGGDQGPGLGKTKRIKSVLVGFYKSLGAKVGPDETSLTEFEWRNPEDPMDAVPPVFSGFKKLSVQGTWDADGFLMIVQDQPQPQTILSVMPFLETKEL